MKRLRKRILIAVGAFVCALLLIVIAYFTLSGRLPARTPPSVDLSSHPAMLSWTRHDGIYSQAQFPYIVQIDAKSGGALLYLGVRHSTDPDDPQFKTLVSEWQAFGPTIALNEGRAKYVRWLSSHFGMFNDPMLTYRLAAQDSIPIFSIEPPYEVEVAALLRHWSPELVAAYFAVRVISSEAGGSEEKAAAIARSLIAKRTNVEGLRGSLSGVEDLDRVWRQYVPEGPNWRGVRDLYTIPIMREIGDASREVRGRHMINAIIELIGQGERVVAVVGASHVIRQEPVLRSAIQ